MFTIELNGNICRSTTNYKAVIFAQNIRETESFHLDKLEKLQRLIMFSLAALAKSQV